MELGLLQREVGQRIGASVATVWLWESNRVEPELKWMPAILGFLGYDPTPAPRTLGERLVRHRTRLGWTQKRLAQALRVDQTTLARWETDKGAPWGKYSVRVAALLQDPDQLPLGCVLLRDEKQSPATRVCANCGRWFVIDPRIGTRHLFCAKAECRRASKADSQGRWSDKPENREYFSGPEHAERRRSWREAS